ncbi:hypothetical protein QBC38DRAFT_522619 [Podospora fimiseda]|uniref:F-box domain-containing protein n=1 Tax=Podospora fimiseda TaxID=252190 RepID=A0AAN7BD38_9PEZI|nr:hypothetical protein QBC38DRAFT_522619 [Podospora fimiseda]
MDPSPKHNLLTIPGELRNQILLQCLLREIPIRISLRPRAEYKVARDWANRMLYWSPILAEGISLVCKQLNLEANALFYAHNTFFTTLPELPELHHDGTAHHNMLMLWLQNIGARNAPSIRHLILSFPLYGSLVFRHGELGKFPALKLHCPHLQTLELHYVMAQAEQVHYKPFRDPLIQALRDLFPYLKRIMMTNLHQPVCVNGKYLYHGGWREIDLHENIPRSCLTLGDDDDGPIRKFSKLDVTDPRVIGMYLSNMQKPRGEAWSKKLWHEPFDGAYPRDQSGTFYLPGGEVIHTVGLVGHFYIHQMVYDRDETFREMQEERKSAAFNPVGPKQEGFVLKRDGEILRGVLKGGPRRAKRLMMERYEETEWMEKQLRIYGGEVKLWEEPKLEGFWNKFEWGIKRKARDGMRKIIWEMGGGDEKLSDGYEGGKNEFRRREVRGKVKF